ncbi:MAG: hypothetical protein KKC51_05115 [Verrucomicrobia bacterium]|nr:hypothetical protein [Verrucomicrobiota bacterium]
MKRLTKMLVVLALAFSAVSASAATVRLVYAAPFDVSSLEGAVGDSRYVNIRVHVKTSRHVGGSWNVAVHYENGPFLPWATATMSPRGNYGTHSMYDVRIPRAPLRFFVRATWTGKINGLLTTRAYQDNNGGATYSVAPHGTTTAGVVGGYVGLLNAYTSALLVERARFPSRLDLYDQYINGCFVVQATSSRHAAGVRLTTDNWRTATDAALVGGNMDISGGYGSELVRLYIFEHRIQSRVTKPTLTVKFKVRYLDETTGREDWDDNFGQYYTVRAGETIQ